MSMPFVEIQMASHTASQWEPDRYFDFEVAVAEWPGPVCGFLVSRDLAGEIEVLNLATAPECRRQGVATAAPQKSIDSEDIFLEVRESNVGSPQVIRKARVYGSRVTDLSTMTIQ